jgi:hypothetical protein
MCFCKVLSKRYRFQSFSSNWLGCARPGLQPRWHARGSEKTIEYPRNYETEMLLDSSTLSEHLGQDHWTVLFFLLNSARNNFLSCWKTDRFITVMCKLVTKNEATQKNTWHAGLLAMPKAVLIILHIEKQHIIWWLNLAANSYRIFRCSSSSTTISTFLVSWIIVYSGSVSSVLWTPSAEK